MSITSAEPALLGLPGFTATRPRIWTAIVVHGVVDFFSYLLIPLMPLLITRLSLTPGQSAAILAAGSLASGLIQPLVAWLSDRHNTRWLGTLGLVLAAAAYGLTGYAGSFTQLLLLQIVGAAGVGAFHPVAAAAVGQLSSAKRSLGVAMFFLGGMIGGIAGNTAAPLYVRLVGLRELVYLIPIGLLAAAFLAWAIHGVPHSHAAAHDEHAALDPHERRWRWTAVWLLYLGNVLRFGVNAALVYLIIEWTRGFVAFSAGVDPASASPQVLTDLSMKATSLNGPMQAAMQIGMGAAGISAGWLVRPSREKRALILVPVWGAIAIAAIAAADDFLAPLPAFRGLIVPLVFALTVMAGIGFGGVIPVTISLSQRLLPHRTGLASGLMMGGAWGVGAAGPPLAEWLIHRWGLDAAFVITGSMLLIAGLASAAIPGWLIRKAA
jgi:FSR family fosmidomycin resistance protein-like MFS transporter